MLEYKRDRKKVDKVLREKGIIVVMNKEHVKTPEHMITTMWEVYQAGYVAECTFRIEEGIISEAMQGLVKKRAECPADNPFILAVGSIINPGELESAIKMGFDMIVAPANVMGGYGPGKEFIEITRAADVFSAPAVFTPTEFQYFIERPDGLEPDAVKIFPAGSHGPGGIKALLAPYVRERHAGRIIIPTGSVDHQTGPQYQRSIMANGFRPVLGMSAPLKIVETRAKPGDVETIKASLSEFNQKFQPYDLQHHRSLDELS